VIECRRLGVPSRPAGQFGGSRQFCRVNAEFQRPPAGKFAFLFPAVLLRCGHAFIRHCFPGQLDGNRNAVNQAKKELANRFDFKGSQAEIVLEKNEIKLSAADQFKSRRSRESSWAGSPNATSASRAWKRPSRTSPARPRATGHQNQAGH